MIRDEFGKAISTPHYGGIHYTCGCIVGDEGLAFLCPKHAQQESEFTDMARQTWLKSHRHWLEVYK